MIRRGWRQINTSNFQLIIYEKMIQWMIIKSLQRHWFDLILRYWFVQILLDCYLSRYLLDFHIWRGNLDLTTITTVFYMCKVSWLRTNFHEEAVRNDAVRFRQNWKCREILAFVEVRLSFKFISFIYARGKKDVVNFRAAPGNDGSGIPP